MLKLNNVNKYFNRHKKNEIHVINNISLEFDNTGLVALLGPSGCGKTTLLNAIGGLDGIKSGSIYIDNKKISSKITSKADKIRNLNIGYIFQDYKLIEDKTVFENVSIVLTMLGLKDKKEIKLRVESVLDKVGMLRYKKRPASMLSGGERQRVGIARALVKNPNIILADEPTGNLDSKNSLEIMKIIKAVSKDRLVILVTHEVNLARFYASRIIELSDGKIVKDYSNNDKEALDYTIDNNIYLKDFECHDVIEDDTKDINIYKKNNDKIKLDIIVKNGNLYIRSNTKDKIEVVDEYSSIELINDNYKKIDEIDTKKYENLFDDKFNNSKLRYASIFNPVSLIINGFKKVFDFSILKKLLLVGFVLSGMFIMYAISTTAASLRVDDEDFVTVNKDYLSVNINKLNVDEFKKYESLNNVIYILPGDSIVTFDLKYNDYYQTSEAIDHLSGSLSDISTIKSTDLVSGNLPNNNNEIIVDKMAIKKMFDDYQIAQMVGVYDYKDLIGREVSINNMNSFKIVGIVDKFSPSIYVNRDMFVNILYNYTPEDGDIMENDNNNIFDYNLFLDKIELKSGRLPENDYEVIVNESNKDTLPINKTIDTKVNDIKLTVVGYYNSKNEYDYYLVNNNTIKYKLITSSKNMTVLSNNKNKTIDDFRSNNLNIKDSYTNSKEKYKKERKESVNTTLLVSGIILAISLIEIFLMIRASFLSRIKSIGIYRAIGVKKSDIYKMFSGEIIAITTLASVPGIVLASYILNILTKIKYISKIFEVNIGLVLLSILFVLLFNIIIGLIPVYKTIRKKPAQILSRTDLE